MTLLLEHMTEKLIGHFFQVYNDVGDGFLESTYQRSLEIALRDAGMAVDSERLFDVFYRGRSVGQFRIDLIVGGSVIVECKAASKIVLAHERQLQNYLAATRLPIGFVLNFGQKPTFKRIASPALLGRVSAIEMRYARSA